MTSWWLRRACGAAVAGCMMAMATSAAAQQRIAISVPTVRAVPTTDGSRIFGADAAMQQPIGLAAHGYVEEEFFVTGAANLYDWNVDGSLAVRASGLPYTTRIVVRRPSDPSRFSGTVLVDFGNRGAGFDTFAVWGQLREHLLARGHAYVGVTLFSNNLGALRMYDRTRYGALSYPSPAAGCAPNRRDLWNRPAEFFPAAEDGIRWDVMSQVGALLKSTATSHPFAGFPVARVYASMQSGGDLPTYAAAISPNVRLADGRRVYDAILIKDSGGPRSLSDCGGALPAGDPRRGIRDAGVPVMQVVAQNAVTTDTRRPDSDAPGDQFRRYELPGASHFDRWQYNYPRVEDLRAAGAPPLTDHWTFPSQCEPHHVAMNDFPQPYLFAGAFANLDLWVREGVAPPRAQPIEMRGGDFVVDEFGNARGGVRTPWVDSPVATFHPVMTGPNTPFRCDDNGYWTPLPWSRLETVYGSFARYAARFMEGVDRLVTGRWVTKEDGERIRQEFGVRSR